MPCTEAVRSLAFASALAGMPRWARQLAGPRRYAMKTGTRRPWTLLRRRGHKTERLHLQRATVAEIVATTCLDGVAWDEQTGAAIPHLLPPE